MADASRGLLFAPADAITGRHANWVLESWLGEATMRDGIRAYLNAHEHGSATSADLFLAIGASANEDVGAVASTFLDQPGVPLVRAELVCDKAAAPRGGGKKGK